MWRDHDQHAFRDKPSERFSGLGWDGADQMVFRPIARFWAVDPGRESIDVNALDEVPDSSWFENRMGARVLAPELVARGACTIPAPDSQARWTVVGGKPGGDNPGFVARGGDGRRYLLKFDSRPHVRATTADVVVAKLYWAAGYRVPCNRVVYVDRAALTIDKGTSYGDDHGNKHPFTPAILDGILAGAARLEDGRYRASASLYLEGSPLGPFAYEGTRSDDPNDVVPHEDRRELRAHRILAAWVGHTDAREANTLDMWIAAKGGGYVRHNLIDFGDCLGSVWEPPMLGRRLGHSAYFDFVDIFDDWLSLGIVRRPWEELRFGPSGRVFGYYEVSAFDPEKWVPGYPNPAMLRMTERDGAWMARILARFGRPQLEAAIAEGHLGDAFLEEELLRVLEGRRRRILARYLTRLSPLAWPEVRVSRSGGVERAELCLEDLAVSGGLIEARFCHYRASAWRREEREATAIALGPVLTERDGHVCIELPDETSATAKAPHRFVFDVLAWPESQAPARVHLVALGPSDYRVIALERPATADPPRL